MTFQLKGRKSCGHCVEREAIGKRYGKLTIIAFDHLHRYGPYRTERFYKCKCDCGNIAVVPRHHLQSGHTSSCGCLLSKGEATIAAILKDNSITFQREYSFDGLLGVRGGELRFDFAIFENGNIIKLIEFDGEQHFDKEVFDKFRSRSIDNTFEELQLHDKWKNDYALAHNIPLYRIPYTYKNKLTYELLFDEQFLIKKEE